jgi:hypothetical protein
MTVRIGGAPLRALDFLQTLPAGASQCVRSVGYPAGNAAWRLLLQSRHLRRVSYLNKPRSADDEEAGGRSAKAPF